MMSLLLAAAALVSTPAQAGDVTVSLNTGDFGVIGFEDGWGGHYFYSGPSVFIPVSDRFAVIPMATFQTSPNSGYWGFAGTMMFEYVGEGSVSFDLVPTLGSETDSQGNTAVWWGVGPGVTYCFDNDMMLGVAAQMAGYIGDDWLGVYPMMNLAVPFKSFK